MDASEDMPLNIACFGQPGSYTYEAMKTYFAGKNISPSYGSHFEDVVQAVATRQARYGVLPIEIRRLAVLPTYTTSSTATTAASSVRNTSKSNTAC